VEIGKFYESAENPAFCGKLLSLVIVVSYSAVIVFSILSLELTVV